MNEVTPEPTDAELDAEITNFHPIYGTPGPTTLTGTSRVPGELCLSALPPESQTSIRERLANVTPGNRDLFEREYVVKEVERLALDFRIRAGAGDGATPYQRAYFERANEIRLLTDEAASLEAELLSVTHYEPETDPVTGEPLAVPVPRVTGDRRTAMEARRQAIAYELALKNGREGEKRMAEALEATKAQIRANRQAAAEMREAERRAEVIVTEERIDRLAQSKARMKRPTGN